MPHNQSIHTLEIDANLMRYSTIAEIYAAAKNVVSRKTWDFGAGGAEAEMTLRRNRIALDSWVLRPRVLRNVRERSTTTTFLGMPMAMPVFFAPVGGLAMFHGDGALGPSIAAAARGLMSFHSSVTQPPIEVVMEAAEGRQVAALYTRGDDNWVSDYVARVVDCGARALCITVDSNVPGRRERSFLYGLSPGRSKGGVFSGGRDGQEFQQELDWSVVDRIRSKFDIVVGLKGIQTAEDAEIAVARGIELIYVSNHGGRQLDQVDGAIDILAEVAPIVGDKAEIAIDGGFLRGTDVLKAVALGADAVGIGKLQVWALALGGPAGLARAMDIMADEISAAMALMGITTIAEVNCDYVKKSYPVGSGSMGDVFPQLEAGGLPLD